MYDLTSRLSTETDESINNVVDVVVVVVVVVQLIQSETVEPDPDGPFQLRPTSSIRRPRPVAVGNQIETKKNSVPTSVWRRSPTRWNTGPGRNCGSVPETRCPCACARRCCRTDPARPSQNARKKNTSIIKQIHLPNASPCWLLSLQKQNRPMKTLDTSLASRAPFVRSPATFT